MRMLTYKSRAANSSLSVKTSTYDFVGANVGNVEGDGEGIRDGVVVGVVDGAFVLDVGCGSVGTGVGNGVVGTSVGNGVGDRVGAGKGSMVGTGDGDGDGDCAAAKASAAIQRTPAIRILLISRRPPHSSTVR